MGAVASLLDGPFPRPGNGDLAGSDRSSLLRLPLPREARPRYGHRLVDCYLLGNRSLRISLAQAPHFDLDTGLHYVDCVLVLEFLPHRGRRVA